MTVEIRGVQLDLNLENGVYVFDSEASTGKTYLLSLIQNSVSTPEYMGITYRDVIKLEVDLPRLVEKNNPVLLVIDRYDMYAGKYDTYIKEWAKRMIVLVDAKQWRLSICPVQGCFIRLCSSEHIVVDA